MIRFQVYAASAGNIFNITFHLGEVAELTTGMHLTVSASVQDKSLIGTYTVINSSTYGQAEVSVKRTTGDSLVNWMVEKETGEVRLDSVQVNDLIPAGKMLILCGGIGITPVIALLRLFTGQELPADVHIIHSCESLVSNPFVSELVQNYLTRKNLKINFFLTREKTVRENFIFESGRVSADVLSRVCPDISERSVRVYGSPSFSTGIRALLSCLVRDSETPGGGIVRINNKEISHNGQQTLLDILNDNDIRVRSRCRAGICGSCRVRLSGGKVQHKESVLSSAERSNGIILACCSTPKGDIHIDLDAN